MNGANPHAIPDLGLPEPSPAAARMIRTLFGHEGFGLLEDDPGARVVEPRGGLAQLWTTCRRVSADLPAGAGVAVLLVSDETGLARLLRWLVLPLQTAIVSRAIEAGDSTILGRYAVFPDLLQQSVVYQLRSAAQRYAERELIARFPEAAAARMLRAVLSRWAGCDPVAGALVIVGRKR